MFLQSLFALQDLASKKRALADGKQEYARHTWNSYNQGPKRFKKDVMVDLTVNGVVEERGAVAAGLLLDVEVQQAPVAVDAQDASVPSDDENDGEDVYSYSWWCAEVDGV